MSPRPPPKKKNYFSRYFSFQALIMLLSTLTLIWLTLTCFALQFAEGAKILMIPGMHFGHVNFFSIQGKALTEAGM